MLHITNDAGRRFQVRCIHKGNCSGRDAALLQALDCPLIEFTDITFSAGFTSPAGPSFVVRVAAETILDLDDQADFWLKGEHMAWRLSPGHIGAVKEWIKAACPG